MRVPSTPPEPFGASATERPSVRFGSYLLDRRIAVGGMSEVYLARPLEGSYPAPILVVKRMLAAALGDEQARGTFSVEARLHASARHPNVVEVFEAGEVDGEPYLAMEYVEGVDASRLVRRAQAEHRAIPTGIAIYIARELCKALARVHAATDEAGRPLGIVHRDVTPSNVYLSHDGDVKLGDFGIARENVRQNGARSGYVLKGKYAYLAPEQVLGEPFDHRADLFSLAVMLAEMLIGQPLFAGGGQLAVLLAIRDCRIEPLREKASLLPRGLLAVLERALARVPDERYASADELHQALGPFETPSPAELRAELGNWVRWAGDPSVLAKRIEGALRESTKLVVARLTHQRDRPSGEMLGPPRADAPSSSRSSVLPLSFSKLELDGSIASDDPQNVTGSTESGDRAAEGDAPAASGDPSAVSGHSSAVPGHPSAVPGHQPTLTGDRAITSTVAGWPSAASSEPNGIEDELDVFVDIDEEPTTARMPQELVCAVRTLDGRVVDGLRFAKLVELVVTGQLAAGDEVALGSQPFERLAEVDALARHLPASTTATTRKLEGPGAPDYLVDLAVSPLLDVLGWLLVRDETGALFADSGEHGRVSRKELYFDHAKLVAVASSEPAELLGEHLVRSGLVRRADLERALSALPPEGHLGDTLVGLGLVDPVQVFRAIRNQGRARVTELFGWKSGRVAFYRGFRPHRVTFRLDLEIPELMLLGLESRSAAAEPMPSALLHSTSSRLVPVRPPPPYALTTSWPPSVLQLVSALGEGLTVADAIAELERHHGLSRERILHAIQIAIAGGIVQRQP